MISVCIMTGSISAAASENPSKALTEEMSKNSAESFIRDYYSSMYLNSEINLESRTLYDTFSEYIEVKLDYLNYVTSDVENFKVSTELKSKEETENGTLFTIWAEASFNYADSGVPAGFGRTAQVLVGNGNKIVDMWINDGIEDCFREEGIEPSRIIWSESATAKERVSEISFCKQSFIKYEQEQMNASKIYNEAVPSLNFASRLAAPSSLTTAQRNKMVTYALNNVAKKSPSSGNSSLVSTYWDFSQASSVAGDCTNFVSHCLLAGGATFNAPADYKKDGIKLYDNVTKKMYWYYHDTNNRANAWSDVETFYSFITKNKGKGPKGTYKVFSGKYAPNHGYEAVVGDIVQISYSGNGIYNHTMIITNITFENNYYYVHVTGRSGSNVIGDWYDKDTKFSESQFVDDYKNGTYRSIHLTSLT